MNDTLPPTPFYAHSLPDRPSSEWQPLQDHLKNVAKKAAEFAEPFGGKEWAYLAGRNHDLGKATLAWQAWLRKVNGVIDEFSSHYAGHPTHRGSIPLPRPLDAAPEMEDTVHKLFDLVTIEKNCGDAPPRSFADYTVSIGEAPAGFTIEEKV